MIVSIALFCWVYIRFLADHTRTVYVTAEDGDFQVYIVPAQQSTRGMREHFPATFYTMDSGKWKRCNKDAFVAKMDAEP